MRLARLGASSADFSQKIQSTSHSGIRADSSWTVSDQTRCLPQHCPFLEKRRTENVPQEFGSLVDARRALPCHWNETQRTRQVVPTRRSTVAMLFTLPESGSR